MQPKPRQRYVMERCLDMNPSSSPRKVKGSSSVETTRHPSWAEKETDRQTYCCSERDMWRTTLSRRTGCESHAELKRLIWNQQQ